MSYPGPSIELQNIDILNQASLLERGEHRNMEPDTGTEAGPVINGETHDANGDTTSSEPRPDLIPRTAASLWNTAFTKVTATPEFQQQMEDSQDKKDAGRRAVMNVLADLKRTKHEPLRPYHVPSTCYSHMLTVLQPGTPN